MATYTIVDKDTDPPGANEIAAGDKIAVSEGDTFIIAPSANANITFQAAGGGPAEFDAAFQHGNTGSFTIKVEDDLTPSLTIGSDVDLTDIKIDAKAADAVNLDAGDNVTLGQFDGASSGANTIAIGDGFSTDKTWTFGAGDDSLSLGHDATFKIPRCGCRRRRDHLR